MILIKHCTQLKLCTRTKGDLYFAVRKIVTNTTFFQNIYKTILNSFLQFSPLNFNP